MVISHQTRAHSLRTPSLRTHSFHRLSIAAIERETPEAVTVTLHVPNALKKTFQLSTGPTPDT